MTFEKLLIEYTGRDLKYHKRYKTTEIEFAKICWKKGKREGRRNGRISKNKERI